MPRKAVKRFSQQVATESGRESGQVVTKQGSPYLYLDFTRSGVRTEISTKMVDNHDNRQIAARILGATLALIEAREFRFAETFPYASRRLLELHSRIEDTPFLIESERMTFGDYVGRSEDAKGSWRTRILAKYRSVSKRVDYTSAIDSRLLPFFGELTLRQITGIAIEEFILSLIRLKGHKKGQPLSASRIRNILTVLDVILVSARTQHSMDLPDPMEYIRQAQKKNRGVVPSRQRPDPQVFRYGAWQKILAALPLFFRPIAELFLLTGMIPSEVAGLRKTDIHGDYIEVRNKVAREEKEALKNPYRVRDIPITTALRCVLTVLIERSDCKYVVTMPDGARYSHSVFYDKWCRAFRGTGISYVRPYAIRHTFAAWSMSLGMDINKLERLMGHGSKEMLFEIYGKYVEGLEEDHNAILELFGADFLGKVPLQTTRAQATDSLVEPGSAVKRNDCPPPVISSATFSQRTRYPGSSRSSHW